MNTESLDTTKGTHLPAGLTHIYFVRAPSVGLVKIGQAWNLRRRFRNLCNSSPVPLQLAAYSLEGAEVEAMLHKDFDPFRAHGEWFREVAAITETIDTCLRRRALPSWVNNPPQVRARENWLGDA